MKLSKAQVDALASQFVREYNAAYTAEDKRRSVEARKKWDASPDGKLLAKLPEWMKSGISGWLVEDQVKKMRDKSRMPKRVDYSEVSDRIIVASIGLDDVEAIMTSLKNTFSK